MNVYRIGVIDWSISGLNKVVSMQYVKGLKSAREMVPVKLFYSRNSKCYRGFLNDLEYVVTKI